LFKLNEDQSSCDKSASLRIKEVDRPTVDTMDPGSTTGEEPALEGAMLHRSAVDRNKNIDDWLRHSRGSFHFDMRADGMEIL